MAKLETLLAQVKDPKIRAALEREVKALKDRRRFGLIFERHLPETVIVGDTDPLEVGDQVRPKQRVDEDEDFQIIEMEGKSATLVSLKTGDQSKEPVAELLAIKRFGDPAYAGLESVGEVRRSETRPAHAVINGENYHTLQLLSFIYERQVDCVYIDPPYNTGARDWTYNNDYVDDTDTYRHSKWLSFMEKRLQIAKRLLRRNGVLIVTIDENELNHLGVLLEEIFPEARRQLVTICINPGGASGGEGLSRVEEYAFFCFLGDAQPAPTEDDMLVSAVDTDAAHTGARGIRWEWLMRGGNAWYRASRENLCYPIILSKDGTRIQGVGQPLKGPDEDRPTEIDGFPVAWPVRKDGKLGIWRVDAERLRTLEKKGYAFVSARDEKRGTWTIKYLLSGTIEAIESGLIEITGRGERNEIQVRVNERRGKTAKTIWYRPRHIAGGAGGTHLLNAFLGERNLFSFPKSVYAVRDALEVAVGNRPDALIVDFFAGSGTTMNATCLLNSEDGGNRRSIVVTNNEVNPERTKQLNAQGYYRGDPEFEKHGIFEAVTKPRCAAAVSGKRADGTPIEGDYLNGRTYAEGFDENVEFFRLDYLDGDQVELGNEFEAIHPVLWLAAGAKGKRPKRKKGDKFLIAPESRYAVLLDDSAFREFEEQIADADLTHVFLVTDSDDAYAEMRAQTAPSVRTVHLYRDFLRHFRKRARL